MMDARERELALRRERLVAQAAQQRRELAAIHRDLQGPIDTLMMGLRVTGVVRAHPRATGVSVLITLLATVALRFTPSRIWWTRGLALYRGGKLLHAMLKQRS
jgi:hypothetical protein